MIVYLIENTVNGKKYVGITTVNLTWRWKEHLSDARHNSSLAIHCAIRKYGSESFKLSILQECNSRDELDQAEISWIKKLDTFSKNGYNLTPGGQNGGWCVPGRKFSDSHKQKISLSRKGIKLSTQHKMAISDGLKEHYAKNVGPNLGKQWSHPAREKHLSSRLSKKKPVFGFDVYGACVITYLSIDDAKLETSLGDRILVGKRGKYQRKYNDGITYVRSDLTIKELTQSNMCINCIDDILALNNGENN